MGVIYAIKWEVQRARYMILESVSQLSDDPLVTPPASWPGPFHRR